MAYEDRRRKKKVLHKNAPKFDANSPSNAQRVGSAVKNVGSAVSRHVNKETPTTYHKKTRTKNAKAKANYERSEATTVGPVPRRKQTVGPVPARPNDMAPDYMMRKRTPAAQPERASITAKQRWGAMGRQSKAARAQANTAPQPMANNTFTQTDPYSRRRIAQTNGSTNSVGIGTGGGARGGPFQPRDTTMGRRALGLPTRAQQNAQRVSQNGPRGGSVLRQGQTRLNLPAANAERMAAADLRRNYSNQRRRNNSTGSAAVLRANTALATNQADNTTDRRGQDMIASTAYRGQDVTARGQDISADTQRRGQDVTARGQDLSYDSTVRGQDVTVRGQDVVAGTARRDQDVKMRGQDTIADTSRYNTDEQQYGANLRNRESNATSRYGYDQQAASSRRRTSATVAKEQNETLRTNITDMHTQLVENDNGDMVNVTDQQAVGQTMALIGDSSNYSPQEFSNVQRNMPQMVKMSQRINQYLSEEGYAGGFSIPELKNAKFSNGEMGVFESLMNGHWPKFDYIELPGNQRIPADFFEGMILTPGNIEGTGIDPGNEY